MMMEVNNQKCVGCQTTKDELEMYGLQIERRTLEYISSLVHGIVLVDVKVKVFYSGNM